MSFISDIKLKIGLKILRSKSKKLKRERGVFNFDNAKTVGIVFNATKQDSFDIAYEFVQFLEHKTIKVETLGFVDSKEVRDFYRETVNTKYFSKKNLNWFGKPKNENVEKFINKSFDILIDLSLIDEYPILYISALSKAKFKVGRLSGKVEYLDFMIDISKKPEYKYLIEQIKHYLLSLNKK